MLQLNASTYCPARTQPDDWALDEFARAQLPDQRLLGRLHMIATAFAQQPTAAIPQACGPGAGSKGAYRFFENEAIEPHTIRAAHHQATLARVREQPIALCLQDTSTLNYSTHPQTQGLGPIGSRRGKIVGLLLHSTLAVTPSGQPLGLLHNAVRARDPKAAGAKKFNTRLTPKELRRLADRMVASKDPEEVARLKKALERGFYGDPVHA